MRTHPYLRAYMAGIAAPTAFFLILVFLEQLTHYLPLQAEWFLWFPLAVIPNAFGAWNIVYVLLHSRWHHPIGLHGAAFPFFVAPIALALATMEGVAHLGPSALVYFDGAIRIPYSYFAWAPFIGIAVYYLVWKYVVGYLNRVVDLPS
jgi:hypothetical protein